ncbi:SPOSA6832_03817, partial [Sporobolomyces salmonicolor]
MPMGPKTISYEDEENYVELDMDEYAERLRMGGGGGQEGAAEEHNGEGRVPLNRRAYERIVLFGLAAVLTSFLIFSGRKAKVRGRLVKEAKVEGLGSKNPPRSNIPLHSFRANLKRGSRLRDELPARPTIEELPLDGPVWANVGRHLQFNSHVNHITDELLTALFGWRRKKFVAVHLRQGDFLTLGRASSAMDEVVETFPAGVKQVQTALQARRKRSKELPVLFATDSGDPAFIAKLSKRGWIHINHIEFATTARFGGWSSGVLDSAILSRAEGFLGCDLLSLSCGAREMGLTVLVCECRTRQSTFSSVAARRVESWNGGVTAIVG